MGVLRLLIGFAIAVGMTGAWILLALLVMAISLYIAKLVPLTGDGSRRLARKPDLDSSADYTDYAD